MITLHTNPLSGHGHRVAAFLAILGLDHRTVVVDLRARENDSPEFRAKNPFGQVPVLEDGDLVLADSTAILVYLAHRYDASGTWLPRDPVGAAQVQRWLSIASGELARGLSAARRHRLLGAKIDVELATSTALALLAQLESHLADRIHLAAPHPTIADLALYAYTARADEAGIPLDPYPNVRAWLARIEALEGFVPMPHAKPPTTR